ncbi:hypothetical protein K7574_21200 (plasmid) [Stenotrophomonas maltophilia]|uniref:hypothetical protein n=1 Tax=Stenotrophomonas maltophilia TaxID=40324 RepID=UPI001D0C6B00|nr:hypothetical protein [Stenotrophomonas maltophilia]UXF74613.1 hypothetical protein K7574_21200 [Stenotrophomonas maltophilia]
MHQERRSLLLAPAFSARERIHLAVPYTYWVGAAKEQQRWLLASRRVGSGVDVTAGSAAQRRQQRATMRKRRTAFLQQARQYRERVWHELALRTAQCAADAVPPAGDPRGGEA